MGSLDEDMAEQERLTQAILKILTQHDPAGVGPGKYSAENEYQAEAREIANWIRPAGNAARADLRLLADGLRSILERRLGVDCHRSDDIAADLKKVL